MKNKILYIIASVMLTGFTSCSDFLDRYPTEELSDGSFWKTKQMRKWPFLIFIDVFPIGI